MYLFCVLELFCHITFSPQWSVKKTRTSGSIEMHIIKNNHSPMGHELSGPATCGVIITTDIKYCSAFPFHPCTSVRAYL